MLCACDFYGRFFIIENPFLKKVIFKAFRKISCITSARGPRPPSASPLAKAGAARDPWPGDDFI